MAIEMSPLAVDWGSVADWVAAAIATVGVVIASTGVFVALAGAIAVAWLAYEANRISFKDKMEAERLRSREADLLTLLFEADLTWVELRLRASHEAMTSVHSDYATNPEKRAWVSQWISEATMPEVDANFGRIHVLPDRFANALARLKGSLSTLRVMASVSIELNDQHAIELAKSVSVALENTIKICTFLLAEARRRRDDLRPDPFTL